MTLSTTLTALASAAERYLLPAPRGAAGLRTNDRIEADDAG